MNQPLSALFSQKITDILHQLAIDGVDELKQQGAVNVFLLLKKSGLTITRATLWRLIAVEQGINLADVSLSMKQQYSALIKSHPPVAIFPSIEVMQKYMQEALIEAKKAQEKNEVPIGAVVVLGGKIIGRGHNQCIENHFVGAHAEMQAIAEASRYLGNCRLADCDLYVTLEPCAMCSSAIIQARIARLIFALNEPKTGAAGSVLNLFNNRAINAHTAIHSGICGQDSSILLQNFFQSKR